MNMHELASLSDFYPIAVDTMINKCSDNAVRTTLTNTHTLANSYTHTYILSLSHTHTHTLIRSQESQR